MKSKYNFSIEQDIFTIYVVILLTALAGAILWASHYKLQAINSQQPIASQVTLPLTITPKPKVAINRLAPEAYWLKVEGEEIKLVSQKVVVNEGVSCIDCNQTSI